MPQWLTLIDSYNTDDIATQKTKTLRFQVNPLVAVGNYDITIGLQGNNGILEPLRIVMKVRGEAPNWSVDPNAYENNMSIVGQIYINGILMSNSESILAAFIDDECRGVASPKQMRGAAYVPMSIYGTAMQQINGVPTELDKGQPVTFRLWDATTGIAYPNVSITLPDGTVTDTLTFDPAKSYGTFDDPIIFTDKAANKVAELIAEEGNPELKLRVFVQGGGCAGFQYGFTFEEVAGDDDTTMTKNGVALLVDPISYQYLVGAEIDYKEDLRGAQFVIRNPNAVTTCGCGSSFAVAEE
jgi:iron-sulfur cluster assembly accessory protein